MTTLISAFVKLDALVLTELVGYIVPAVKLEFGSLIDKRPVGWHTITSMLANALL